jgi:hypothetical protein
MMVPLEHRIQPRRQISIVKVTQTKAAKMIQ